RTTHVPLAACTAPEETAKKVGEARWAAHEALPIVRQLDLCFGESFGRHDGGDRHGDPLIRWPLDPPCLAAELGGGDHGSAVVVHAPERVAIAVEDAPDLRQSPLPAPTRRNAPATELTNDRATALLFVDEQRVDQSHDLGLGLVDDNAAGRRRVRTVAVGIA